MLPRAFRLRGKRDMHRAQRSPLAFRNPRLTLRVVHRHDRLPPRVAIAVGRHVSPRAVDRNRVTRWIREALRPRLPQLSLGADLRFSATAPFSRYAFRQCAEDVHELLQRAGMLRVP